MKKLRVLVLVHASLIPPAQSSQKESENAPWKTEYDVVQSLKRLGHEVSVVGLDYDLGVLRKAIFEFKPQIVYNLLVEFQDMPGYEQHIVSYLELVKVPYTGCNPRGLMLSSDKALCKKILSYHRIPNPKFFVIPKRHRISLPKHMSYPMIVKSLVEEASLGISQSSVVRNEKALRERVEFIHESIGTDAIVESYIEGREFYVGILGNRQLTVLPVWELDLGDLPEQGEAIATSRVKWSEKYRKKYGIRSRVARNLPETEARRIQEVCRRVYRRLGLTGYARIDLRFAEDGGVYVLEANPNPNIAMGEEFPDSAEKSGLSYDPLNQRILNLGLSWFKSRR